ncbi:MAG TPA: SCO family protein [Syntrophobacteria bacterium]|nr:SCO family protein [archaeon]HYA04246.1 SCO family protein [Syntrophobacteria bacterium]
MKVISSARHMFGSAMLLLVLAGILATSMWVWQDLRFELWNRGEHDIEGLQVFGTLPDFSLTERSGRNVTLADLRGKVWIANFIYTHCTDTCPLQSARIAKLQDDFVSEWDLRFVSITVDPMRDTPKVLAQYAARFGADPERWLFLTGEKQAIYALAQQGFHLSVEAPEAPRMPDRMRRRPMDRAAKWEETTDRKLWHLLSGLVEPVPAFAHSDFLVPPFLHSSWFVLVDRQARIRGYYQSDDEATLQRLRRDTKTLLRDDRP